MTKKKKRKVGEKWIDENGDECIQASAHWEGTVHTNIAADGSMGRWEQQPGVQQATILPFQRWDGVKHEYALTVDIENLTDPTRPDAKINFVVDRKVVKTISVEDLLQTYFNL
jgi:hypothetical protein